MPRAELPGSARCVVIGGGVGGTSIAYHLAELGWDDVVLLDRNQLTSGSTFHSAGLVGQLRGSVSLTKMMMYSVELYRKLGEESEFDPGWVECGGIRLASSEERMEELRRQAGWAKTFGLPLELISAEAAKERFPLMSTDGVLGAAWLPTDGYLDPAQLTYALADGARGGGCQIFTSARVTGIEVEDGRVRGVRTERGDIETELVVNAGGMYGAEIGRMAGVRVPVIPMSHEYLVTQPFRDRDGERLPTLRDPDLLIYFREDAGGLVMGGYEQRERPRVPPERGRAGSTRSRPTSTAARSTRSGTGSRRSSTTRGERVPAMDEIRVTKLINGPEGFTPDNEFCLGETEVLGFFVACGFCAHGLAGAGGIGKVMAEWIVDGEPSLDLWHMDIRRFGAQYRSPAFTHARIKETYETYYDIVYPNHEREAGRPLRVSPANAWHAEHGAAFGEKSGWERVNWYESNAADGDESLRPRGLGGPALVARDRSRASGHPGGGCGVRRDLVLEDGDRRPRGGGGVGAAMRQRGRPRRRRDHLHADAEPARGHRVRLHRRPARRGPVLDRHRDGVRQSRPRVDPQEPAPGGRRAGARRHLTVGVHGDLGTSCPRRAAAADATGPRQRGVSLHDAARDHGRERARAGAAGHLRRRARVGAVLPDRVRAGAVADAVGGRSGARHRRRRLPGDRLPAAGEGLPRVGRRHHPGRDARTRAGSGSASSSTRRAGSSAARRCSRRRSGARERGCAACCSTIPARSRSGTSRSGSTARCGGG